MRSGENSSGKDKIACQKTKGFSEDADSDLFPVLKAVKKIREDLTEPAGLMKGFKPVENRLRTVVKQRSALLIKRT